MPSRSQSTYTVNIRVKESQAASLSNTPLGTRAREFLWCRARALLSFALLSLIGSWACAQEPATPAAPKDVKPTPASAQAPAAPVAPSGPAPGAVTITGLIDGYYQINFQHPKALPTLASPTTGLRGSTSGGINATRAFDYHNNFGLSLGEINISRTAGRGFPLGVTATLTVGDTPGVVEANEPGGKAGYEGIQQLYLTYTPHLLGRDVTLDFGKFASPFGNEVIESPNNDNYSRGLVFTYGVPYYHTGLRVAVPLAKKLVFQGGVVNGWNNTTDDNNAKSFFTQFTWTPDSHFTGVLGYLGGAEGTGTYGFAVPRNGGGNITTNLLEFVPTWNINGRLKLAGDLVYANGAGDVQGVHVSGSWIGLAAYVRYQWMPRIATAVRVEQFEDIPGVGRLPGSGGGGLRFGSGYTKVRSFTATLEYTAFHGKLISRLEYRHDRANQPFGLIGPDQDTLTLGEAYKF